MVRHRPAKTKVQEDDADRVYPAKKTAYRARANKYFDEYEKIMVISCDNVQSKQMQQIRDTLRGKAVILMGKNTTIKRILLDRSKTGAAADVTLFEKLSPLLKQNVGLVFTNGDLNDIKDVIDANKVNSMARQGAIAPCDVSIPCGNTGMDPQKTSFFQALGIATKITKGMVEILKDELIVKEGTKVGSSEAALLQMLGIKPFYYGIVIRHIYENGSVYGRKVLEMTEEDMKKMFAAGVSNVTALSLATGITTQASMPHVMMNAFKNLLAVCVTTDFSFSAANGEELKEAIVSGKGLGGPAPAAAAAAAPAAAAAAAPAAAAVVEEEDDDEDMGFDLFD